MEQQDLTTTITPIANGWLVSSPIPTGVHRVRRPYYFGSMDDLCDFLKQVYPLRSDHAFKMQAPPSWRPEDLKGEP